MAGKILASCASQVYNGSMFMYTLPGLSAGRTQIRSQKPMGKEFELKYQASPEDLKHILEDFGDFSSISMETHYYDTKDGSLGDLRWTLRRRLENGVSVCGLKTPGKNLIRGEWEVESDSIQEGVLAICQMDVPEGFREAVRNGLKEVCGARFTRQARIASTADGTVEIALDQGVFLGGGREKDFSEVEVELKSGSREAAEAFARKLAGQYGLQELWISKFERAFALSREG